MLCLDTLIAALLRGFAGVPNNILDAGVLYSYLLSTRWEIVFLPRITSFAYIWYLRKREKEQRRAKQ